MAPNRKQRASIAKETLQIIEAKKYNDVNLEEALERSVKNSRLFTTSELNLLRMNGQLLEDGGGKFATEIQVTDELSIECCLRLKKENPNSKIGCLNFASAKNPCGGMFSGALAQEESLGLCSTLYPTLIQFKNGYYEVNKKNPRHGFYHDELIWSPEVQIIREDRDLSLLANPISVDFITCPAVNKGRVDAGFARNESIEVKESVDDVMRRRVENVLTVAASSVRGGGGENLTFMVLGAWGCGVFKNETQKVAGHFHSFLKRGGKFEGAFEKVVFAVGNDEEKVRAFKNVFL